VVVQKKMYQNFSANLVLSNSAKIFQNISLFNKYHYVQYCTEMLDSSSEAAIETSDKSQLTDQPIQENKTTAISRRKLR